MIDFINISMILSILGALHGLVLAIILFSMKRKNNVPNQLLAGILIILSFIIMAHVLSHTLVTSLFMYHNLIEFSLYFSLAPLFYFYIKTMIEHDRILSKKKVLLHLIPFFWSTILLLFVVLFEFRGGQYQRTMIIGLTWLIIFYSFIYIFMSVDVIKKYNQTIKDNFASVEKNKIKWLYYFLIVFLLLNLCFVLIEIFVGYGRIYGEYRNLLLILFFFLITYFNLRRSLIFSDKIYSIPPQSEKKYEKSVLKPDKAEYYLKKLHNLMQKEKVYLDSDINLFSLSNKLRISTHHLSQIINAKLGQNFFDFINSYRIKEAQKLLANPNNRHISISEIAFNSGFNTISVFNSAFKKYNKMTPSQYRKLDHPEQNEQQ